MRFLLLSGYCPFGVGVSGASIMNGFAAVAVLLLLLGAAPVHAQTAACSANSVNPQGVVCGEPANSDRDIDIWQDDAVISTLTYDSNRRGVPGWHQGSGNVGIHVGNNQQENPLLDLTLDGRPIHEAVNGRIKNAWKHHAFYL